MPRPSLDRAIDIPIVGDYKPLAKDLTAAKGLVGKFGAVAVAGFAAAGVAAAGFGVAVGKSAIAVDNMRATIGRATGLAGDDLDALTAKTIQLQGRVVQSGDVIAGTVGAVRTFFGGTDDEVTALTERILRLSHLTGGNAQQNAEDYGKIVELWGLDAASASKELDGLNRVTQDYGISADELFKGLAKQGGAFRNLGFDVDETAVLIGRMSDAGFNLRKQGPAIEAFLGRVAKAGGDPATALGELEARIKGAATDTEALQIASEAFGQSYGSRFGIAVRTGALALAGISEEADGAAGSLQKTWDETLTLQDRWKLFTGSVAREMNERVFPHLSTFVGWMDSAIGQVDKLDGFLERMVDGPMTSIGDWVREVWPKIVSEGRDIWYIARQIAAVMWDLVDGPLRTIGRFIEGTWLRFTGTMTNLRGDVGAVGNSIGRLTDGKLSGFIGKLGDIEAWIDGTWAGWMGDWGTLDSDAGPISGAAARISGMPGLPDMEYGSGPGGDTPLGSLAADVERLSGLSAAAVLTGIATGLGAIIIKAAPALMNPVGLAIGAVAAAVGGLVLLYNNNPGFKKWLDDLWAGVSQTAIDLWNDMGEAWGKINEVWGLTVGFFKGDTNLVGYVTGLKAAMEGLSLVDVAGLLTKPWELYAGVLERMNKALKAAVENDDIGNLGQSLAGAGLLLSGVWEGLTGLALYLGGSFLGDVALAERGLESLAGGIDSITTALLSLPKNLIPLSLDFIVNVTLPAWWNVLTTPWKLTWKLLNWAFDAAGTGISAIRDFVGDGTQLTREMEGLTPAAGTRQIPVSPTSRQTQSWQGLPPAGGFPAHRRHPFGGPMFGGQAGAIVTRPTRTWIGEVGPEAVIPLDRAPGAFPIPNGGPTTIVIELNGRELGRAVVDNLNDIARKSSSSLGPLRAAIQGL